MVLTFSALLLQVFGVENVIGSDIKQTPSTYRMLSRVDLGPPMVYADVASFDGLARIVLEHGITHVVHLASLLSAIGEQNPQLAIKVNSRGTENILEVARLNNLKVFIPSSIAAFGPSSPKDDTPNECSMRPTTVYGVTKVYTELMGEYYHQRYGVDFRSLRFPGIISSEVPPGGGTTDYAVAIYYQALKHGRYTCFLEENQVLPMMYMPDCLKSVSDLMQAPNESLTRRSYNITGMSFTPKDLAASIQRKMRHFEMSYDVDFRQKIAESWPRTIDDSTARADWGWKPDYDIDEMTDSMLNRLGARDSIRAP
ncbi:unnamed protein product [Polarella glacialis]|uniref:L-threonine 3-dehydrogenase, mitochondrial n=1 Tax=Polarella glacialis TaxID=89957 RepID=A0A813LZL6_POLGL|nr:unnamed protein product [Polarella glacialis]